MFAVMMFVAGLLVGFEIARGIEVDARRAGTQSPVGEADAPKENAGD